ncbi:MAG TPA: glycogen/starch synthase [Candidatus Cloacimonadota bacterium]|mgnify:CR=1 FL=1|nr:glycogen/starch synthase [Candidatus Cloacimonadota bacterium]HPK40355.1 glycogen/starch synthase [Candidatus Cloacimonadota bacterium]
MKVIQVIPELASLSNKTRQAQLYEQFILNLPSYHAFTILPYLEHLKINSTITKLFATFEDFEVFKSNIPSSDSEIYLIKPKAESFTPECFNEKIKTVLFFNQAVAEFIISLKKEYTIHCHSPLTGFLPLFLQNKEIKYPCLFTLHNLKQDYRFNPADLTGFVEDYTDLKQADTAIKVGVLFSDIINLCSRKYAQEVLEENSEYQEYFMIKKDKLYGIMNGIRYGEWNPVLDEKIPCKYSPTNLYGRFYNKAILQEKLDLPDTDVPLLFFGTRLSDEKGFNILLESIDMIKKMPVQLLIYGTGDEYPKQKTEELLNHSSNIRYIREYDEDFVHFILAGSDFYLLPAKVEPDGISFLYALKYGLIPIAYHTGGHVDAIGDLTNEDPNKVNGFFFHNYDSNSFIASIREAIEVWRDKPLFGKFMNNAMEADWSWKSAIRQYEALYQKVSAKV